MCGGDLNLTEGQSVMECKYCGTQQTVPNVDDEKKLTLFARANRLRMGCEFDKAAGVYESIVADFPEEAEAYWGLVLCKYGIEYVDDPATGKKVPTCHRSSFDSVMDDPDLEQALENADPMARRLYREEAKAMEELRRGIIEVSGKEEPYDIFICYKETDDKGGRTIDSVIAQDVYDALTDKGYRVFFSRITLEDKLGQEYEPYIFAALNSAKIMLAFGTDYEYYNAVWVKNEWSRYLKLMAQDKDKHLIPCYKGIDAYDMPKEFAKLQAQDMGKVGAIQDLLRGIEKLLPKQSTQTVIMQTGNASALAMRGQFALEDGDWNAAAEYFERALDQNPQDGDAYLGKVLASLRVSNVQKLKEMLVDLDAIRDFDRAIQFTSAQKQAELLEAKKHIEKRRLGIRLVKILKAEAKKKEAKEAEEKFEELLRQGLYDAADEALKRLPASSCRVPIMRLLASDHLGHSIQAIKNNKFFGYTFYSDKTILDEMFYLREKGFVERDGNGLYWLKEDLENASVHLYSTADEIMRSAIDASDLLRAADMFATVGKYTDAPEKEAECKRLAEQYIERKKEEEKQKAAEERAARERKAAEERAQRKDALEAERTVLQRELANLKGLFTGKRRKEIESRLAKIYNELASLQ